METYYAVQQRCTKVLKTTVRLGEVITHVMKSLTRKEMKDCFDVHAEFVLACGFSDFQRAKIPE